MTEEEGEKTFFPPTHEQERPHRAAHQFQQQLYFGRHALVLALRGGAIVTHHDLNGAREKIGDVGSDTHLTSGGGEAEGAHCGHGPICHVRARGVGEPPIVPTAAAVANAIKDQTGARITDLPMTPQRVFQGIQ